MLSRGYAPRLSTEPKDGYQQTLGKPMANSESTSGFFVGSGRIAFKPLIQRYRAAIEHAMQGVFAV